MNTAENQTNNKNVGQSIRTSFPLLRTFIVETPDRNRTNTGQSQKAVTGFVVLPTERQAHEQEFPGLFRYNLKPSEADGATKWDALNTRIRPSGVLLYTAEPVDMWEVESADLQEPGGYAKGGNTPVLDTRKPTHEEMKSFCTSPNVAPLLKDFPKGYLPYDVNGERILPAESWNVLVERAETDKLMKKNVELLQRTITGPVTDKGGKTFQVDFNLAGPLQRIIDAGYHTGQSDSGTVSDHPNNRYIADSQSGLYRKGDPIAPGKTAYMTFWLPEAQGVAANTERQIQHVKEQAAAAGWRVDVMPIYGQPSIRLTLPETMDGSSALEINREVTAVMKRKFPELTIWNDIHGYLERADEEKKAVVERHGGYRQWTDDEVMDRWDALSGKLAWCMQTDRTTGQLTGNDVNSYLLDKETGSRLSLEHEANREAIVKSLAPQWGVYRRMQEEAYEKAARNNGFDSFNENEQGTGVRNYTALGKRADADVQQRLEAFDRERDELMEPAQALGRRLGEQCELLLRDEAQRYLQAIHALTAPMVQRQKDFSRLSDISVYGSGPEYNRQYSIRCKIDGVSQFGKELNRADRTAWMERPGQVDTKEMAARYFRDELDLSVGQEQDRGMRR